MASESIILTMGLVILSSTVALSTHSVFAQYFGDDAAPLTQEQKDYCEAHEINPCTQNNILAKKRLFEVAAPKPFDWTTLGIVIVSVVAIIGLVVIAVRAKKSWQPSM